MKVLLINGSSNVNGCTYTALSEVASTLKDEGVQTEVVQLGSKPTQDCIGCFKCVKLNNACVFNDDIVNCIIQKAAEADGFIFGTPVYYAHPNGRLLAILNRVFFAGKDVFRYKPGAAVVSARRAGTTASIDVLNKYFTISEMPVVSSSYWNMVHGNTPDEVREDLEGMQSMRNLGRNMAWLLKCIKCGSENGVNTPLNEYDKRTSFIR